MFSYILDKLMSTCYCGSPLIAWRNVEDPTFTVQHVDTKHEERFLERSQLIAVAEITAWLEEIHGLRTEI